MNWNYSHKNDGTCLQGYVDTTYDRLVKVLGQPNIGESDKVLVEWCLVFEDNTIATIYCWKRNTIPTGQYSWHIGGHGKKAVRRVVAEVYSYFDIPSQSDTKSPSTNDTLDALHKALWV